jgi:hypothetical protein
MRSQALGMRRHSHETERGWNMGSCKQKEMVRKNVQEKRKVITMKEEK